jgi:hypothetical protein
MSQPSTSRRCSRFRFGDEAAYCVLSQRPSRYPYGAVVPIGETDPETVLRQQVNAQLDRECPVDPMREFLIDQARPGWYARKQEIEAELREQYGGTSSP